MLLIAAEISNAVPRKSPSSSGTTPRNEAIRGSTTEISSGPPSCSVVVVVVIIIIIHSILLSPA